LINSSRALKNASKKKMKDAPRSKTPRGNSSSRINVMAPVRTERKPGGTASGEEWQKQSSRGSTTQRLPSSQLPMREAADLTPSGEWSASLRGREEQKPSRTLIPGSQNGRDTVPPQKVFLKRGDGQLSHSQVDEAAIRADETRVRSESFGKNGLWASSTRRGALLSSKEGGSGSDQPATSARASSPSRAKLGETTHAAPEMGQNVAHGKAPSWATLGLKTGAAAECVRAVFLHHAKDHRMDHASWNAFLEASEVRKSSTTSENVTPASSNPIFYTCAGGNPQAKQDLALEGFLTALAQLALLKYPYEEDPSRSLQHLIEDHILAYGTILGGHAAAASNASSAQKGAGLDPVALKRVETFIAASGYDEDLDAIFRCYAGASAGAGGTIDSRLFHRLCHDSRVTEEEGATDEQVQRIYMAGLSSKFASNRDGWLSRERFLPLLVKLAMAMFSKQDQYTAAVRLIVSHILPFAER